MVVAIGMDDDHRTTLRMHFVSLWRRWLISLLTAALRQVGPELTQHFPRSSLDRAARVTIDVWMT